MVYFIPFLMLSGTSLAIVDPKLGFIGYETEGLKKFEIEEDTNSVKIKSLKEKGNFSTIVYFKKWSFFFAYSASKQLVYKGRFGGDSISVVFDEINFNSLPGRQMKKSEDSNYLFV